MAVHVLALVDVYLVWQVERDHSVLESLLEDHLNREALQARKVYRDSIVVLQHFLL